VKLLDPLWASLLTSGVGVATWLGVVQVSHRREAWDSSLYFIVAMPLIALVAGVVSYVVPTRVWRWALFPFMAQALVMVVGSGDYGLLPLGLIAFGIIGSICLIPAWIGAGLSRNARQ